MTTKSFIQQELEKKRLEVFDMMGIHTINTKYSKDGTFFHESDISLIIQKTKKKLKEWLCSNPKYCKEIICNNCEVIDEVLGK